MAKKRAKSRTPRPAPSAPRESVAPGRPAAKASRAERIEATQRQKRRRRLVRRGVGVGVVLLAVGLVTSVVISNRRAAERTVRRLEAGGCRFDRSSDSDAGAGRNHVAGTPTYRVDPPAGGDHAATPAAPAVYSDRAPPDAQVVHAMEHGDVVLFYRPDLAADAVAQLRDVAARYADDVLVVARPSLTVPVAATAWHRRLLCPAPVQGSIELFARTFRDKGPEKQPQGQ